MKISFSTFIKDPAKAYSMYEKSIEKEVNRTCKDILEENERLKKEVKHLSSQNNVLREANKKHKETISGLKSHIEYTEG